MILLWDRQFDQERQAFALAFQCEQCVHFNRDQQCCSEGYPDAPHREARALEPDRQALVFCKHFELE